MAAGNEGYSRVNLTGLSHNEGIGKNRFFVPEMVEVMLEETDNHPLRMDMVIWSQRNARSASLLLTIRDWGNVMSGMFGVLDVQDAESFLQRFGKELKERKKEIAMERKAELTGIKEEVSL